MKIRTLLILALISFSVVPSIVFGVLVSSNMNSTGESQYNNLLEELTENASISINTYVSSLSEQASKIAGDTDIKTYLSSNSSTNKTAAQAAIERYCDNFSQITRIVILNSTNKIILSTQKDFKIDMPFEEINSFSEKTAILYPVTSKTKTASDYEILSKAKVGNNTILVYNNNSYINGILSSVNLQQNGKLFFIDANNGVLDTDYAGKSFEVKRFELVPIIAPINSGADLSNIYEYEVGRDKRIASIKHDEASDWYAVTYSDRTQAYGYSSPSAGTLGIAITLITVIITTAYIILVIVITSPLKKIEEALLKIRKGDYESRIEIMSKNEYGDIARAFNSLIDEFIVSERRYRSIVEMSDNIVFEWNFRTNNLIFSNNFNQKFSYRAPSDNYSDSFLLKGKMHPDDVNRYRQDLEKLSKGERDFDGNEYRWKNIYGDYTWSQMKTSTIRDKDGVIIKIVGVISDIDRAKRNEDSLLLKASYDALTGIYNRATIENIIDNEIGKKTPETESFAILFVDIDNFKHYNDKYSHATGDQVIKFTATTIQKVIRDFGFVGRYGGDEFVILLRNAETNSPTDVSKKLLEVLKEGFVGDNDIALSVNVSIGISIIKDNTKHVEEIISMADDAMYRIKKCGKSNYGYF